MYIVRCADGTRWKVRQAISLRHAVQEIAHAKVLGSIGSSTDVIDYPSMQKTVLADVHRINSDGSEVRAS